MRLYGKSKGCGLVKGDNRVAVGEVVWQIKGVWSGKPAWVRSCILTLFRASHMAKSEDLHGNKTHYELRRQYHCAAYTTLMAVIMCTQNKMQFYHGFLFKEDTGKVKTA